MKTKSIEIPGEVYTRDAVNALNDLLILSLKGDGLEFVESEVRMKFKDGRGFQYSNMAVPMPEKKKPKPLKKRK